MKFSLAPGPRGPLTRDKARTYLTANMGFPGLGSLMAGKWIGYAQALMTLAGLGLSMVFGTRFAIWFVKNWSQLQAPSPDPLEMLRDMWLAARWALLGIALFASAWIWGLLSGLLLMAAAKKAVQHPL
jgi:hypothetical protein